MVDAPQAGRFRRGRISRRKAEGMGGPVPVSVEEVKQEDFEEWVNLAGTVTPLNVVTVRSRVDGELKKVHFTEGPDGKGRGLNCGDRSPSFPGALDQAKAPTRRATRRCWKTPAPISCAMTALLKQDSIAKQQVDTQASLVQPIRRHTAVGSRRHRECGVAAQLYEDHDADHRPRGTASDRCRQHDPRVGRERSGDRHANGSHGTGVLHSAGARGRGAQASRRERGGAGGGRGQGDEASLSVAASW